MALGVPLSCISPPLFNSSKILSHDFLVSYQVSSVDDAASIQAELTTSIQDGRFMHSLAVTAADAGFKGISSELTSLQVMGYRSIIN